MTEVEAGTLIDGRYRIVSRLGSGGMADVFLAEDEQLGRKLALKLLHRRFSEDPGFVERFRREAQAAAGLQHPNIVSVYDRGAFDGTYYIAMEYVPGRSLKQVIRQEAPIEPVRAIDLTIQILKAARFAHRHGVIHRDLKPHNVIVDDTDHAKVTDFGIARAGASDMTETGSIMGTAQYLSPEQAQGHAVSAASDLYSVGVVLYEMLTGQVPFDAEAAVTIALKHVSETPAAPRRFNPGVPPELEQVAMWALNKNPADRPHDADEFIAALEAAKSAIRAGSPGERTASMAALAGVGVPVAGAVFPATQSAKVVPENPAPPPPMSVYPVIPYDSGPAAPPPGDPRRSRSPWPWIALLLALLLAGGAVAYLLTRPAQVPVPDVIRDQLPVARTILQNAGFRVSVTQQPSTQQPQTVIGEIPVGGTKVDRGSTVALTVSSGPGNVSVPTTVGDTPSQASRVLAKMGLKVGRTVPEPSSVITQGGVIDTDPPAGTTVPAGSIVTLLVSSGKGKITVPDETGQSEQAAKQAVQAAGFRVTTTTEQTTSTPAGEVVSQTPAGNSQATPGSIVNLVIAQTPTTASVPNVQGQTAAAATSALQQAGFTVSQTTKNVTDKSQNGVVLSQTPKGGTSAKKGSTVTIVVGHFASKPTTPTTPTTSTTTTTTPTPTTTTP